MSEPLLRVSDLTKHFPVHGGLFVAPGRQPSMRSTACRSRRRSRRDAGARRRIRLRQVDDRALHPAPDRADRRARSWFDGEDVAQLDGNELRALRRDMQIIFQDPFASLNPRMTVGAIIGEALTIHKLARNGHASARSASRACSRQVGLQGRAHAPLSARILRRPAPAHRHRARARGRAEAHRLRRAGVGARRLDPGAGHQPAGGSAGRARTSPISSSRTTSRWSSTSPTASR